MKTIILFILLALTGIAQVDTSAILLTFNEPMRGAALVNRSNYKITDSANVQIQIFKVKVVPPDSTMVVIYCKRIDYKKTHKVVVSNVRDRAGNLLDPLHDRTTFIFEGIEDSIPIPETTLRKK